MTKKGNCGEREGRGETTISVWEDTRFFLLPSPPIVTWTSASPPQTAYLRAFRTVLFAFSLSANWKAALSALHSVYTHSVSFSFVLSLFHSLSFASNFSAIPIIIASRVPRILGLFVICLSSCRHSSPFSQLYYRSIILFHGCFYARRRGKIVTLWLNEVLERCWNFVLALHRKTDLLWISYERISSNSRARSESENALLKKLIIDHPSNEQIVRSDSTVVVTSYSDTSSEYTEFDARLVHVTLPGVIMRLVQTPLRLFDAVFLCMCICLMHHWD